MKYDPRYAAQDDETLAKLMPSAREEYDAGRLKFGDKVKIKGVPYSRGGVVHSINPLHIIPMW